MQFNFSLFFYPSFLSLFIFLQLYLVADAITPWVVVILAYLLSIYHLAGGEASSSSTGGAPHCRRNQQN
jgi:hypothetical protein